MGVINSTISPPFSLQLRECRVLHKLVHILHFNNNYCTTITVKITQKSGTEEILRMEYSRYIYNTFDVHNVIFDIVLLI